ncbi:MAG: hypothetical protein QE271_09050 [Bacteriovoracaceae bacterium]|nr:hypothetical protein [Bacteriovoracaceae bacterium]
MNLLKHLFFYLFATLLMVSSSYAQYSYKKAIILDKAYNNRNDSGEKGGGGGANLQIQALLEHARLQSWRLIELTAQFLPYERCGLDKNDPDNAKVIKFYEVNWRNFATALYSDTKVDFILAGPEDRISFVNPATNLPEAMITHESLKKIYVNPSYFVDGKIISNTYLTELMIHEFGHVADLSYPQELHGSSKYRNIHYVLDAIGKCIANANKDFLASVNEEFVFQQNQIIQFQVQRSKEDAVSDRYDIGKNNYMGMSLGSVNLIDKGRPRYGLPEFLIGFGLTKRVNMQFSGGVYLSTQERVPVQQQNYEPEPIGKDEMVSATRVKFGNNSWEDLRVSASSYDYFTGKYPNGFTSNSYRYYADGLQWFKVYDPSSIPLVRKTNGDPYVQALLNIQLKKYLLLGIGYQKVFDDLADRIGTINYQLQYVQPISYYQGNVLMVFSVGGGTQLTSFNKNDSWIPKSFKVSFLINLDQVDENKN